MRRLAVAVSLAVLVVAEAVPAHASVDGEFFFPCPLSERAAHGVHGLPQFPQETTREGMKAA
jgi:hypothetical protein